MEQLTGHVRAAIDKYHMIEPRDKIAVGVSGGKDSMYLLYALHSIQAYHGIPFELTAITIDPQFGGREGDYSAVEAFCRERGIPYIIRRTDLANIIFEEERTGSPCSLCARMRRGILHNLCVEYGLNKIALGHHLDDAAQTFLMNLFYGGKVGCFAPVTWLSRKRLTLIRPLVFCEEADIRRQVYRLSLPIVKSLCPVDGETARKDTADLIRRLETPFPDLRAKIIGAMQRGDIDRWGVERKE